MVFASALPPLFLSARHMPRLADEDRVGKLALECCLGILQHRTSSPPWSRRAQAGGKARGSQRPEGHRKGVTTEVS
jgi:hypothetical protein